MVWLPLLTLPEKKMLPVKPAKVFQSASWSVPVELLPYMILTRPPALKKYLAEAASANVMV